MFLAEVNYREKKLRKETKVKNAYKKDALVLSEEAKEQIKIQKKKMLY